MNKLLIPLLALLPVACGDKMDETPEPASGGPAKSEPSKSAPESGLDREAIKAAIDKGVAYLMSHTKDGMVMAEHDGQKFPSSIHTAFALGPIAQNMPKADRAKNDFVQKAQKFILGHQKEDGRIAAHEGKLDNYYTSATLMSLAIVDDPATKEARDKMLGFIRTMQRQEKDRVEGGFGYNTAKSADLSNTQYAIEALRAAGVPEDDPAMQKAIAYLERTQNRSENEANKGAKYEEDGKTVVPGNDGSAAYEPGVSKAGMRRLPDGTYIPRGYGSMTYALLKCYILVGLDKDDPRVQAVLEWLGDHYTWSENPGFEDTVRESSRKDAAQARHWGLYYYYATAAKALRLLGKDTIKTPDGERNWRADIAKALLERQNDDGSWVNDKASRWNENDRLIVTCYALIALQDVLGLE